LLGEARNASRRDCSRSETLALAGRASGSGKSFALNAATPEMAIPGGIRTRDLNLESSTGLWKRLIRGGHWVVPCLHPKSPTKTLTDSLSRVGRLDHSSPVRVPEGLPLASSTSVSAFHNDNQGVLMGSASPRTHGRAPTLIPALAAKPPLLPRAGTRPLLTSPTGYAGRRETPRPGSIGPQSKSQRID
jgi:hypothetical protein